MKKIVLRNQRPFAKGNGREIFLHPEDSTKIIKIEREKGNGRGENRIDVRYHTYLKKRDINVEYIAKCFGWVETDRGKGVIFEKVCDHNGALSRTLQQLENNSDLLHRLPDLLEELKNYLEKNRIVFADPTLGNIAIQEYRPGTWRLKIIDGLGARHYDWKLRLAILFPYYAALRVRKQWPKLLKNLVKDFPNLDKML